ncbi:hypothetical protein [Saccharopolyspora hattusasensis]|uniref:hypothetical protein n=1 Tax=Saccharopolyspora hattusasensis TaxID=1128679 RepID=UPI003D99BB63
MEETITRRREWHGPDLRAPTNSYRRRHLTLQDDRGAGAVGAKIDQTRFDAARALARINRSTEVSRRVGRATREKATQATERLDR